MTADEIRKELDKNVQELYPEAHKTVDGALGLLQYGAQMEIAAQLAELNVSLKKLPTAKTLFKDIQTSE